MSLSLELHFENQPSFVKAGYVYYECYMNTRRQSFYMRYIVSEILKNNGNNYYKSNDYLKASEEYEKSLSIFRYIRKKINPFQKQEELEHIEDHGENSFEKEKIINLKLGLYLNLSLCYLIMGRLFNALRASQEALKLDPYNAKALYRSAKAKIMNKDSSFHELTSSKKELEFALHQQPNDQLIKQELSKLNEELMKYNSHESMGMGASIKKNTLPYFNQTEQKKEFPLQNTNEFKDLEKFLNTKGQDIIKVYEAIGKYKEAEEFKKEIKTALEAKNQIEKIGMINFDQPNEYMMELAEKYNIDVNNPLMKSELLKIQNHNLNELRQWVESLKQIDTESLLSKANNMNMPLGKKNESLNDQRNGNNYYINNNFYSPLTNNNNQFINNFGSIDEEKFMKWIEYQKSQENAKSEEELEYSGVISFLNILIILLAILFALLSIIFHFYG